MILVLAGTRDGRELAAGLAAAGFPVLASAATPLGSQLLRRVPGIAVREGALEAPALERLITARGIRGILDATHPFAAEISHLAREVAERCGIPYLRWERPPLAVSPHPLVYPVPGWEEAAACLASLGVKRVFLAVGVKPLELLLRHPALQGCRFTVRVLPVPASVAACRRLGLGLDQIIAYLGPGTRPLNQALLEAAGAEALVIKDSGEAGGSRVKLEAALALGIPVVVVQRPRPEAARAVASLPEVLRWANECQLPGKA